MIEIVVPPRAETRAIQQREGRFYWSRCAPVLFRREGFAAVHRVPTRGSASFAVYTRGCEIADLSAPAALEGPLDQGLLERLGLRAETCETERVDLGHPIDSNVSLPGIRVRTPDGVAAADLPDSWRVDRIPVQFLAGAGWEPVVAGSLPGESEPRPVGVRRGGIFVLGLPLLDVLCRWMAVPPLSERYGGFEQQMLHVAAARALIELIADIAESETGESQPRLRPWPAGSTAGFTVRHDYDRPSAPEKRQALLDCYARHGVRASVGFLPQLVDRNAIDAFRRAGHEIQAHVAAEDRPTLRDDLEMLRSAAGPVRGATIHGGPQGIGFRGQTHFEWFDDLGIDYCETFGLKEGIGTPVCRLYGDVPDVSALLAPPAHHSLDGSTRPDDHHLKRLSVEVPAALKRGDHVVVMNHPDVHGDELRSLIESLDLGGVWRGTTGEILRFHRDLLYTSTLVRRGSRYEMVLAPLERDAELAFEGETVTIPAGTERLVFPGARPTHGRAGGPEPAGRTPNQLLSERKLAAAAELLDVSPERAETRLLGRAIAGMPRDPHPRYTLPHLDITSCERVGDDLVRIALERGRVFFGHRSEQAQYVLYHLLRPVLPDAITGDAYKLATDIHSRYIEGTLPWYFGASGVYVEGGCFTGLKAVKWHDALPDGSKVIAVEIGGSNFDVLQMNVQANALAGKVVPVHAGLWRETGEGVQRHSFSTKRFLESTDRWADDLRYEEHVQLLTIDDLLDQHDVEVAEYVNIQVNGAEIHVLEGLRDLDRVKVLDVAAYYGRDGVQNRDVVREMLSRRGCRLLSESAAGRLAFATPKHAEEVMARKDAARSRTA